MSSRERRLKEKNYIVVLYSIFYGGLNQLIFSLMCQSVVHLLHFGFYKKQSLLSRKKETTIQSKETFDIINLK
jgi:hypothetical protein